MTIRAAHMNDMKELLDLNQQIFEHERTTEPTVNLNFSSSAEASSYLKKAIDGQNDHALLVYDQGGKVIGYAAIRLTPSADYTHRTGIRLAHLHHLGVDRAYRGQGIGRQLIQAAKAWARQRGANRMTVTAYTGNESARGLYHTMGFRDLEVVHEVTLDHETDASETK